MSYALLLLFQLVTPHLLGKPKGCPLRQNTPVSPQPNYALISYIQVHLPTQYLYAQGESKRNEHFQKCITQELGFIGIWNKTN